jgi:hypothetical protein
MSRPGTRPRGKGRAEIRTFVFLHGAALAALEQARSNPAYRVETCLHALVAAAFSVEAYLNHLGPKLFRFWSRLERLSPLDKLAVILSELKYEADFGARPFQSVQLAFRARNLAAHAKTHTLRFSVRLPRDKEGFPIRPQTELERLCTLAIAERVVADTGDAITRIHEMAGKGKTALWFTSEIEWTTV